jgi:sulfide:quinone oxidoreductase
VSYDLLIGVPPHRAPSLKLDAGLVDASGYVPVHPRTLEILSDLDTLEVRFPGVFAIGDVASIRLLNATLLPKAGVFAEAHVVAAAIAAASEANRRRPASTATASATSERGGTVIWPTGPTARSKARRIMLALPCS